VRRYGAAGYINKTNAGRDLLKALDTIVDGGTFFSDTPSTPRVHDEKGSKGGAIMRVVAHCSAAVGRTTLRSLSLKLSGSLPVTV